jgi:DNA polymerase-3 subunit delta'
LVLLKSAGQIRYNPDYQTEIMRAADALSTRAITRYHRSLTYWQGVVNHPLNARLFVEQLLLSYKALLQGASEFESHAG